MNISSPKNLKDTIYITDQSFDSLENNKKRLKSTKHDFEYQVNIHGYNPDEIKFNIEENNIVIHVCYSLFDEGFKKMGHDISIKSS